MLVDGGPLTSIMHASGASSGAAAGGAPLRKPLIFVVLRKSPLADAICCRPHLTYAVTARLSHSLPSTSITQKTGTWERKVASSDITVANGELVVERLRCPAGCRLAISPLGLAAFNPLPRLTLALYTPPLSPIPPNGCRMELRLSAYGSAISNKARSQAIENRPSHAQLQDALAHDICPALNDCEEEDRVRLVESRYRSDGSNGLYVIFDMLARSTIGDTENILCKAFAAATSPKCLLVGETSPTNDAFGITQAAGVEEETCSVTSALFERPLLRHFVPSGGVVQLLTNGTEVQMAPWLLPKFAGGTTAAQPLGPAGPMPEEPHGLIVSFLLFIWHLITSLLILVILLCFVGCCTLLYVAYNRAAAGASDDDTPITITLVYTTAGI